MLDKLGFLATGLGFTSIAASVAAWYVEKGEDKEQNAHAERYGIFIGLWPPAFFALAVILFKLQERGHDRDVKRLLKKLDDTIKK